MQGLTFTLVLCAAATLTPAPGLAQRVQCTLLSQADGGFQGHCTGFDEGRGSLDLRPDEPVPVGPAPMALPVDVAWTGTLEIPRWPTLRLQIESSPYEPIPALVMKSQVAWFLIEDPLIDEVELGFWFQFDEDAPPTRQDLEILQRAEEILGDERVWDRSANRQCRPGATTWTLYCALRDATVEVTEEFHDRQPALVILRDVIDGVFREKGFQQPLIDYNTYDDAILVEMHRLLGNAASRVSRDL